MAMLNNQRVCWIKSHALPFGAGALRLSATPQQKSHRKNAARPALDPNLSDGAHSLEDHLPNDGILMGFNGI